MSVLRRRGPGQQATQKGNMIVDYFEQQPTNSLADAARDLPNITKTVAQYHLKKRKFKAFKTKFLHTLEEGDRERRFEFCLWAQGNFLNAPNFLDNIIYTDEATFTTNGIQSSQNSRYWTTENPYHIVNCRRQYSQKINVFCGISGHRIFGPFFFRENLNGDRFLTFLQGDFDNTLDDIPLLERNHSYLQLDGAPIHGTRPVVEWLETHFPNKWIGRNSPVINWPPRSPDLTPVDFFLWGHLKNEVYRNRPRDINELCARITASCNNIDRQVLRNVSRNNRRRIEKCIELEGGLVEQGAI